jgi:hypothetical protein
VAGLRGAHICGIVVVFRRILERCDPQIDLAHLEADDLDVEIETNQRQMLELLRQQPVIPDRNLGQPVIGDHESAGLPGRQVIQAQGRHLCHAQLDGGKQPAMTGYDVAEAVGQDRNNEAESLDAASDLPDLLFAVPARVRGIRLELVDSPVEKFERLGLSEAWRPIRVVV